ncbi:MAG TPA: DUF6510 family protein [Acidimicrobiales bacterium]|nr:DUF6510 family protein [Acidimicrobiales bacterium]
MDPSGMHIDGNGIAGTLEEIFTTEITMGERICQSCGSRAPIGAHRAYRGAGLVLRCPVCGDLGARVGLFDRHHVLELRGTWVLNRSP